MRAFLCFPESLGASVGGGGGGVVVVVDGTAGRGAGVVNCWEVVATGTLVDT